MLKELDKRQEDYLVVLRHWRTCSTLLSLEISLIDYLIEEAEKSLHHFDQARRGLLNSQYFGVLLTAVTKARAKGLLQDWNDYVTPS